MKKAFVFGIAVLALSAAPLFAQAGQGTSTQQPRTGSGKSAQTGTESQTGSQSGARQRGATPGAANAAGADQHFVMDAAKGGMAEVELGKLASDKASSDPVKQFAQRMVDDHGKANDELKSIAQQKNITLPTETDPRHKALHDRLSKLSGAAFDRAYMNAMLADHRKDVSEFRRESQSGKDPEVKAFAAKHLPTLEDHLKLAQDTSRSAVGTSGKAGAKGSTGPRGTSGRNPNTGSNPNSPSNPKSPTPQGTNNLR